jgi:hypothetical protein
VTALETTLRQICGDLTDAKVSFTLVGGLAVSARTEPRFTRDVTSPSLFGVTLRRKRS